MTDTDKFEAELRLAGIQLSDDQFICNEGQITGLDIQRLTSEETTVFPLYSPYLHQLKRLLLPPYRTGFTSAVLQMPHLTHLKIAHMSITSLPDAFYSLDSLQYLDLAGNQLNHISSDVALLTQLKCLNLGGNQLSTLPDEFGELLNLRCLALGSNNFSEIPKSLRRLTGLQQLYLYNNSLKSLPDWIADLQELILVSIDVNPLVQFNSGIMALTRLKDLRYPAELPLTPANYFWLELLENNSCRINQSEMTPCYSFNLTS